MSCNCKNDDVSQLLDGTNATPKISIGKAITKYTFKSLAFLLLVVLLPLINLVIIWFMFEMIVLNKNVDLKPMLVAIGKRVKPKDDDDEDDDDDYDELTEDDVVMLDVEDITNKKN